MVIVPARDEEDRVCACIAALAAQVGAPPFEVVLVLDACVDATEAVACRAAADGGLELRCVAGPERGVGFARRAGFDAAAARLRAALSAETRPRGGRPSALSHPPAFLASTDADSVVAPDWLAASAAALAEGAAAVGGRIELDPDEARQLPPGVLTARAAEAERRLAAVRRHTTGAEHHQFSGASLALTLAAYDLLGGLPAVAALEDEALERALLAAGLPVTYAANVRVTTSARTESRVPRGLAQVLRTARWRARTDEVPRSARAPGARPAGLEASGGSAVPGELTERPTDPEATRASADPGVRSGSSDDPGVRSGSSKEADVLVVRPRPGSRGADLHAAIVTDSAELVLVLGEGVAPSDAEPLLEALQLDPACVLARAAEPEEDLLGELVVRPALNLHAPELALLHSPLTRTWAARGALLRSLALPAGDAVDLTVLLDAWAAHGLDAISERPLPKRSAAGRSSADLPLAAYELLCAFAERFPEPPVSSSAFADPSGTRRARLERLPPVTACGSIPARATPAASATT